MVRESSSKMLLLVSDVTTTCSTRGFGGVAGKETKDQNDEDEDEDEDDDALFDEDDAREKVRAAVNLCESSARMKTMVMARCNTRRRRRRRQIFEAKDDVVVEPPREGKTTTTTTTTTTRRNNNNNNRLLKASASSSSSREKSFFVVDDVNDVNDANDECREETEIAAVSWFPPATTAQKDDGKDAGEDDGGGGACCVPWTKASSSESKRSVGERLRVTQCERSMRAKKTAEDLFMEEIQTPTKKVKKNTGKRDATIARTENGLLHRRAAREAMKLIEDVKRNELSAMDIVCLIPILVDDGTKNTTPFDANDPMKWPKNLVLAHGVVKRAKERFGGEKVRVKIVPIFVAATPEENETTSDAKATETRSAREALINARLEQVSNVWGFTNTVVGSTSSTVVSDASVMWRGKILIGGGLKTKLSSKMKNKSNDKGINNSGRSRSSTYRTYDRCIAAVEVSRECSQCVMPFLPVEPSSDNLDDVEGLEEERDGETKAIQTATAKKTTTTTTTTTKSWKKTSKRKGEEEDEGEDETVLKIYDIVLMSAIDAIDIDASQAPRHVSFSPINSSNWMTAYASFCAKKYDEGVPGECPVLLCSIATATPMVVACDKKGAFDDKEEDDDNDVRSKKYGRALVVKDTNKFFPAQSRDERVFVLAPFFSTMNTKKGTSRTSVAFRLVKLVDARSALERRVLFPRTSNQNQNEDVDFYSSQPPLLALPGSDTRRLSVEEERLDEALKTVAKMVVSRGGSSTSSKEGDEEENEEEKFERISGVIDAYFAKRKKRRGGKASAKDDSMREYCIAWMKFLYFTKKDASTIAATSSTTLHHHHNSINNTNNNNGNTCSAENGNDEEGEEHNELKRFYDALENASKETADDIRHDVSLASVLRSAAVDCEKKLENSETVARLLRSRMPSRNVVLKRKAGGKDGDGKKRQKVKKGVTAKKRANNAHVTAAAAAATTTTPNDVTDKLAKFRQGGGGVAGELKKRHAHANNPTMTTTNTTNSSAEEIRKRKLNAAASTLRYNNRNNAPSNGSALVAMATNTTNTTTNNNNTTTASLSQQRPSESGAGSGAFGGRGRGTTSCQKCNRDLEVKSGMNYCPYCGGPLHR